MMIKCFYLLFLCFLLHFRFSKAEVVCSEDELIQELIDDIADNGKLDCLRENPVRPGESVKQRELRLKANWNSDCSFESESAGNFHWKTKLEKYYGFTKGLVDVDGNPVDTDFDDQADMCEIIRALIANNFFPNIGTRLDSLDPNLVQYIDCPGGDGQTEVCAATHGSFSDKNKWHIFLEGQSLTIRNKPQFEMKNK